MEHKKLGLKSTYYLIFLYFSVLVYVILYQSCQSNPYIQGEILYQNFCANCHIEDGTGLIGNIPPLANSDFLTNYAALLPCIIRYGIKDTIVVNGVTYNQPMEGIAKLTDIEIVNIINYMNHSWGNKNGFTKPDSVTAQLKACKRMEE